MAKITFDGSEASAMALGKAIGEDRCKVTFFKANQAAPNGTWQVLLFVGPDYNAREVFNGDVVDTEADGFGVVAR